jgi:hypothetical protein
MDLVRERCQTFNGDVEKHCPQISEDIVVSPVGDVMYVGSALLLLP